MGQVIQFPLNRENTKFVENETQRLENIKKYQFELCLNSAIELTYQLFDEIQARGIDLSHKEDLDREMLMVCESIKSVLMKASELDHPLQRVTSQLINVEDSSIFMNHWKDYLDRSVDS
jgi:ABC-type cobalamin transport system ATPase subunit